MIGEIGSPIVNSLATTLAYHRRDGELPLQFRVTRDTLGLDTKPAHVAREPA